MDKSGFQKNFEKYLTFGPNHSRYVPLRAGLPLPSSCCKGKACLPRLIYVVYHLSQNNFPPSADARFAREWWYTTYINFRGVSRGKCGLPKTGRIFSANNEQGTRIFTLGLHYSCIPSSIFFQSFSGNHFSPRFMVPCSLLAENIFSLFRSPHLPGPSIH